MPVDAGLSVRDRPRPVSPWATQLSAGPPSEAGQTLTFFVAADSNPGLFSAGPAVTADGILTFTPATGASGSATLSVELMDNGGTANGGTDTSAPHTFIISVTLTPTNRPKSG